MVLIACFRRASTAVAQHSAISHAQSSEARTCRSKRDNAQHSAISHAQSSEARTCRSKRDNARKQTELARANMSSSIYLQFRCVFKINEKIEICKAKQKATTTSSW